MTSKGVPLGVLHLVVNGGRAVMLTAGRLQRLVDQDIIRREGRHRYAVIDEAMLIRARAELRRGQELARERQRHRRDRRRWLGPTCKHPTQERRGLGDLTGAEIQERLEGMRNDEDTGFMQALASRSR